MTWTGDQGALLDVAARLAAAMVASGRQDWEIVVPDAVYGARLLLEEVERTRREVQDGGPATQAFRKPLGGEPKG